MDQSALTRREALRAGAAGAAGLSVLTVAGPAKAFPAPGWYGVANVKWLTSIELQSERFAGRFMARDYVTAREEVRAGDTVGRSPRSARTG